MNAFQRELDEAAHRVARARVAEESACSAYMYAIEAATNDQRRECKEWEDAVSEEREAVAAYAELLAKDREAK